MESGDRAGPTKRSGRRANRSRLMAPPAAHRVLAAVGLNDHELAPGHAVIGLLASPREVRRGDVRVGGARVGVAGERFLEGVNDGVAVEPEAVELRRSKISPIAIHRLPIARAHRTASDL